MYACTYDECSSGFRVSWQRALRVPLVDERFDSEHVCDRKQLPDRHRLWSRRLCSPSLVGRSVFV